MTKLVLLCKRALSELEKDALEKHLSCVYFNERVHINKSIGELITNCELLVLDIFKEEIRSYYEGNHKWLKDNGAFVILLEKSGEKVDKSRVYCEHIVKKYLPLKLDNKELFINNLKSPHIPKVKPTWVKYLGYALSCIKSAN